MLQLMSVLEPVPTMDWEVSKLTGIVFYAGLKLILEAGSGDSLSPPLKQYIQKLLKVRPFATLFIDQLCEIVRCLGH